MNDRTEKELIEVERSDLNENTFTNFNHLSFTRQNLFGWRLDDFVFNIRNIHHFSHKKNNSQLVKKEEVRDPTITIVVGEKTSVTSNEQILSTKFRMCVISRTRIPKKEVRWIAEWGIKQTYFQCISISHESKI